MMRTYYFEEMLGNRKGKNRILPNNSIEDSLTEVQNEPQKAIEKEMEN